MRTDKCLICGELDATKTNSHLIPSFMIAKVCSYDGSGKRDREVMFTMDLCKDRIYTGALPDTKIEELFDIANLSDERIQNELRVNPASKDYIFCPKCESKLSKYLEAPYSVAISQNKSISSHISYFFWLSIIWRMSISDQFGFKLPQNIEEILGHKLNEYLNAMENNHPIEDIILSTPFSYRLIRASHFLPNKHCDGFLYGFYDKENNALLYNFGDTAICAHFDNVSLNDKFTFLGLEKYIREAKVNTGIDIEKFTEIDNNSINDASKHIICEVVPKRLQFEYELVNKMWNSIGLNGTIPLQLFKHYISQLYSNEGKQGDRRTPERYVAALQNTLDCFGYKLKEKQDN